MKRSVIGGCIILVASIIAGCAMHADAVYSQPSEAPPVERRMGVVDSIYTKTFDQNYQGAGSFRLYIIKVDNKEYIVNSRGGIVEHIK